MKLISNRTPAFFGLNLRSRPALLAALGGLLGGGQALLGLQLAAGGAKFALAFVNFRGLVLVLSRRLAEPSVAHGVNVGGRVGGLVLAFATGAGTGLVWRGRVEVSPSPIIPFVGWIGGEVHRFDNVYAIVPK